MYVYCVTTLSQVPYIHTVFVCITCLMFIQLCIWILFLIIICLSTPF